MEIAEGAQRGLRHRSTDDPLVHAGRFVFPCSGVFVGGLTQCRFQEGEFDTLELYQKPAADPPFARAMTPAPLPPLDVPDWLPMPEVLLLRADEIHVWRIALDRPEKPGAKALLDPHERRRSARIHDEQARRRFEAAHVARRILLGRYLGRAPERLSFVTEPKGKPGLGDSHGLEFNLSHSTSLAVLAVAQGRRVGVDIERVKPVERALRIAERMFSPAQLEQWRVLPDRDRPSGFFRLWTDLEARQKVSGAGLFGPRPAAEELSTRAFVPAAGFVGAIAWEASRTRIAPRFYSFGDQPAGGQRPPTRPVRMR